MKIKKCTKPIIWAIGFFLFSTISIAAPIVSFGISDNDIQINETFSVDVLLSGVDPFDEVFAFGFDIDLDPSWSLVGPVTIGPGFDFDDSTLFPHTDVAGSALFGPSGDDIVLATLQLIASSVGVFDLGIVSDLFDFNEGAYLFSSFDAFDLTHDEQVTISSATTSSVPEPGPIWLYGVGIVAFFGVKRDRVKR